MRKLICSGFLALGLLLVASRSTFASEGHITLLSTVGRPTECDVKSTLLGDYNLLVSCSDLTYSVSEDLVYYVVWATPLAGANPIRLGDLALGRALLKTKTPFSGLFVTQEKTKNPKTPTGSTVMRGNVQTIATVGRPSTSLAPNADGSPSEPGSSPSPTAAASSGGVGSILRSGGVITAVAIFLIILMLILVKPFK